MKLIKIVLSFFSISTYSQGIGSERFQEFNQGVVPWTDAVILARDPARGSNLLYSNSQYVDLLPKGFTLYGAGDTFAQANSLNFMSNYVRSAARTEPRGTNFINNSLPTLLNDFSSNDSEHFANLTSDQKGNPKLRYLQSSIINPASGYYQSADNQQAFNSAFENVQLIKAEEALFIGDEQNAINHFNQLAQGYQQESDKQNTSSNYNRDGLLRTKQTAETFRDFYRYKQMVSDFNLSKMPTANSLIANCQNQKTSSDDNFATYNSIMGQIDTSAYNFSQPTYNFDFCETYVHSDKNFLLQNLPVHEELAMISQDSQDMFEGLEKLASDLGNKSLTAEQIFNLLKTNPAWNKLKERSSSFEECKKTQCLDKVFKNLKKITQDYKGAKYDLSNNTKEVRSLSNYIIQNKKLPDSLKSNSSALPNALAKIKPINIKKQNLKRSSQLNKTTQSNNIKSKFSPSNQISAQNTVSNFRYRATQTSFYRDNNGVLRGKSGKPIMGFAAKAEHDLFKIISLRYKKKFFSK